MTETPEDVGIDVAKRQLEVGVRPGGESWTVENGEAPREELVSRLRALAPAGIVVEATGGLELPLVGALATAGLPGGGGGTRGKCEHYAGHRAAGQERIGWTRTCWRRFGEAVRPTPRPVPDAQTQELSGVLARRHQLVEMLAAGETGCRWPGRASRSRFASI